MLKQVDALPDVPSAVQLAATLMERNPSLAAGIAAGHVRVDTRSIRSVDALSDTLLSNSYVD